MEEETKKGEEAEEEKPLTKQEEKIKIVEDAKDAAAKMKEENDRKVKLLEKEEKLIARREALNALGGGSPAGQTPAKPAEKTAKEYADDVMAGKVKPN
jgi:hypothetical protein